MPDVEPRSVRRSGVPSHQQRPAQVSRAALFSIKEGRQPKFRKPVPENFQVSHQKEKEQNSRFDSGNHLTNLQPYWTSPHHALLRRGTSRRGKYCMLPFWCSKLIRPSPAMTASGLVPASYHQKRLSSCQWHSVEHFELQRVCAQSKERSSADSTPLITGHV